ncbi:MAG: PHP-associated domain-containing protein [Bacilli bacterium]
MIIDFHTHAKLSKDSEFSIVRFQENITMAKHEGLDAVFITEHFNTLHFEEVYSTLNQHYAYEHHYYNVDGLRAFSGMEVDVKNGGHILVSGHVNDILSIRERLQPHVEESNFVELATLLSWAEEFDCFVVGAHPFRESNSLHQHDEATLRRLHAFDLNGKDLFTYGIDEMKEKVHRFAAALGKPVVTGSDTHYAVQFGCVRTKLASSCNTVQEVRELVQRGAFEIQISPALPTKVFAAKTTKKVIKESMLSAVKA